MRSDVSEARLLWSDILLMSITAVSGGCVMVVELLGTRILAPYVGTSLYVWTSVIGVVLAFLSIGYALGGRIADRGKAGLLFPVALSGGGILTFVLAFVYKLIPMTYVGNDLVYWSLIASVGLFGPLAVVLGMVSPLAVRLRYDLRGTVGGSAGNVYAASTVGSIAGTFLAGYWLIPSFAMQPLLFGVGAVLLVAGGTAYLGIRGTGRRWLAPVMIVGLGVLAWIVTAVVLYGHAEAATTKRIVDDINTPYRRAYVWETTVRGNEVRVLADWQSAIYLDASLRQQAVADYARTFRMVTHFARGDARALLIGGAGYILPRLHLQWYPRGSVDVVEIDPAMPRIAKEYFFLEDDPRIQTIIADGRVYLNETQERYDVIYMDAFAPEALPFHLVTKEAFQRMSRALTDDGVLVMNMIASTQGERRELFRSVYATMQEAFPYVRAYVFAPANQKWNIVLVASRSPDHFEERSDDPEIDDYLQYAWRGSAEGAVILTDEYAPVEHLNLQ